MLAHRFHETLVRLAGIHAVVGGTLVLRDIDAEVRDVVRPGIEQGQIVAILGPSGIGKSTLLRVLAGLLVPNAGRVLLTDAQVPVRPGMVGVVHQGCPLLEHRRVIDNLLVRSRDVARARALLERFGLADRADAWPGELSGGQRQRVAILQQVMCGHSYLVLDEPFSGLDPFNKGRASELLVDVSHLDHRQTIFVVTHDIREAIKVADTLWLLGRDRLPSGERVPGSRIVDAYNLIERDLAWTPGIERTPQFAAFVRELEDRFSAL